MDNSSPRSSRRASVISHANSAYSQAGSTRHILAGMDHNGSSSDYGGLLNPPMAPFASGAGGIRGSRDNLSVSSGASRDLSLSVNYLPTKFSSSIISPGGTRFRRGKGTDSPTLPKRGGGLDAFKAGESRMPHGKHRLRWNKFKWILFVTNTAQTLYSLAALVVCLLTWFDVWEHADVIRAGNRVELILSTIASCVGIVTSVIGWAGILLNNRGFLAWYTFLTWITFAFMLIPGYITYKRRTFNLEGKVNAQWSKQLGSSGRLRIQNQLQCCGYFNPFIEATISSTCYARSILPGCKLPYLQFERKVLAYWFRAVFILVPVQIAVMLAGLMCSNHITYRFGKGMMPEAYRLNMSTMAVIMDNYANQLAEQYGNDVAADVIKRTKLDSVPTMNYDGTTGTPGLSNTSGAKHHPGMSPFHAKYDSVTTNPKDHSL